MFTANFDNLTIGKLINYTSTAYGELTETTAVGKLCFKSYDGKVYSCNEYPEAWLKVNYDGNGHSMSQSLYSVMLFGSSNAEEDYYDYTVELVTNLVTQTYESKTGVNTDGTPYVSIRKVIKNNSTETKTIREIGIFTCTPAKTTSTAKKYTSVLLYRKKLDTEIVLEPQGLSEITLNISLNSLNMPSDDGGGTDNDYNSGIV